MEKFENLIMELYGVGESKKVKIDKLLSDSFDDLKSVQTIIRQLKNKWEFPFRKSAFLKEFIRCYLPYRIETYRLTDELLFGLFVNRDYQPLGYCCYSQIIPYNDTRIIITKGFLCKKERSFYFYNDGNAPYYSKRDLKKYIEKLEDFIAEIKQEQFEIRRRIK